MELIKCETVECEPPFGGKENCEFNSDGRCIASSKMTLTEQDLIKR